MPIRRVKLIFFFLATASETLRLSMGEGSNWWRSVCLSGHSGRDRVFVPGKKKIISLAIGLMKDVANKFFRCFSYVYMYVYLFIKYFDFFFIKYIFFLIFQFKIKKKNTLLFIERMVDFFFLFQMLVNKATWEVCECEMRACNDWLIDWKWTSSWI